MFLKHKNKASVFMFAYADATKAKSDELAMLQVPQNELLLM